MNPQTVSGSHDQREYGSFQNELYRGSSPKQMNCISGPELTYYPAGLMHQQLPLVTTDPNKLEDQAKSILKASAFDYVAGGAGERATMDANRLAFRQWKMVPRMLSKVELLNRFF
jgi:lactate 2-monooxygenase